MPASRQRSLAAHPPSLWTRVLTFACVLLVFAATSAQLAHIHGDWLPSHNAQAQGPQDGSQVPGGELNCPLCIAMHAVLPSSAAVAPVYTMTATAPVSLVASRSPETPWHFAAFSRPPPALYFL